MKGWNFFELLSVILTFFFCAVVVFLGVQSHGIQTATGLGIFLSIPFVSILGMRFLKV